MPPSVAYCRLHAYLPTISITLESETILLCSLYGIALVLFIASVVPTLISFNFCWEFVVAYAVRLTQYFVLGVTVVFSNKYNVRRLVTLNLIYLAICFFMSTVTDFHIILINANEFIGIDNIPYYMILIFVTLFRSVYKELHADRETGC